jgi:hypothetical protein
MGFQQPSEFVLEADHAVMAFLLRDLFNDFFHVRRAHGEPALPALPMEIRERAPLRLDPLRGTRFNLFNYFRQGEVLRQSKERMNVVTRAAHLEGW